MFLYRIYQWLIAYPILLVLTILTALATIIGTSLSKSHIWGYYPAHIWSRCVCTLLFIRVKVKGRENIDKDTSLSLIHI